MWSVYRRGPRSRAIAAGAAPVVALALAAAAGGAAALGGLPAITPFSAGTPGEPAPAPWHTVTINERKLLTEYVLVREGDRIVLHAHARASASALGHPVAAAVGSAWLHWSWKWSGPIAGADPSVASREDSPARIVLEFDGDVAHLPLRDRAVDALSVQLSGRHLPYATLMYVVANRLPTGTIVQNPHTRRVQMIVVADATVTSGTWQSVSRNVRDDYRHAFGEEPGALLSLGVMTDTDNTDTVADAWYGDIRLADAP